MTEDMNGIAVDKVLIICMKFYIVNVLVLEINSSEYKIYHIYAQSLRTMESADGQYKSSNVEMKIVK